VAGVVGQHKIGEIVVDTLHVMDSMGYRTCGVVAAAGIGCGSGMLHLRGEILSCRYGKTDRGPVFAAREVGTKVASGSGPEGAYVGLVL
jgi:hypothetical protein